MRQLNICMCKYCYFYFRKFYEGSYGMRTCKAVADTE